MPSLYLQSILPALPHSALQSPLFLFHAAALPGTALLGSNSTRKRGRALLPGIAPLSSLAAAQVPLALAQLRSRLLEILPLSADDAVAAAKVHPLLQQLLSTCCLLAAHDAGMDLAGPGVYSDAPSGPYPDRPEAQWLRTFASLAPSPGLAAIFQSALDSGLMGTRQLRGAVMGLRPMLRDAGAVLEGAGNKRRLAGASTSEGQDQLAQALDTFTDGCRLLGAGKLAGMVGTPAAKPNTPAQLQHLERWRSQVELLWPGTKQLFKAALDAGLLLTSIRTRFVNKLVGKLSTATPAGRLTLKSKPKPI